MAYSSYAVAVVLLPPPYISALVDPVRSANDKSWPRWPAHVTVLFPFPTIADLSGVTETLRTALSTTELRPFHIKLDKVAKFATRDYETIYLGTSDPSQPQALWNAVLKAVGSPTNGRPYVPHLTLGQAARNAESITFLEDKARKLLERHSFSWLVDNVALLRKREDQGGIMELYAQLPIGRPEVDVTVRGHAVSGTPTYHFDGSSWEPTTPIPTSPQTLLTVATYNILHDPSFPFPARLPFLLSALLESDADIICIQEVTDEALSLILHDERIRERWPWCSRHDMAVMESERNVIMLAREAFGFEWVRVELGGKHKACIIASLRCSPEKSIIIVGLHLTAGRTQQTLDKKRVEVATLLSHLHEHHSDDEWILIGDVNWPSDEDFPNEGSLLVDCGGAATYDPTSNTLAAATARQQNQTPERYDRVFLRKGSGLAVNGEGVKLFGLPGQEGGFGSDHWGLKAVVQVAGRIAEALPPDDAGVPATPVLSMQLLSTTLTEGQLHELCTERGYIPSNMRNDTLRNAVNTLRNFLSSTPSSPSPPPIDEQTTSTTLTLSSVRLKVTPVGSFAMGYHIPASDVDCVVIGNISPTTFWTLVRSKIRSVANGKGQVRLRRFVRDALVQMMELDVDGVKVDLQYCPAGKLVECWDDLPNIPRDSPLFSLPVSALRTLNAHRDVLALHNTLSLLDTFRLAHRSLRLFLVNHGILGARFGYLGSFHLAVLLAHICLQSPAHANAAQLVRMFFHVYARWDWASEAVSVHLRGVLGGESYCRSNREPMVVLSVERPQVNTTVNANENSVQVMKNVIAAADRACEEGLTWREICGEQDGKPSFGKFVRDHKAFVKIEINYWGSSCMKGRALIGWLESRFVGLLVQLQASTPTVHARLWPVRFADGSALDDQSLSGFYLIGLSSLDPAPNSEEERQLSQKTNTNIKNALTATLRAFEGEIQTNTRFYEPKEMFVSVINTTASQLPPALMLDPHKWSDGNFDEEDDKDSADEADTVDNDDFERGFSPISSAVLKKRQAKSLKPTPYLPATKLRTSSDVYNRLMWDPAVSKEDYVIGYEDRFKGVKEMPLGSWKREVEDEAFIPFHRVVHFRRKSDNVTVWDRKTKTDLVFGSGVKSA